MNITLIPGNGIGPEIVSSTRKIIDSMKLDIKWDEKHITTRTLTDDLIDSIKSNKVALKGPLATPIGHGHKSLNVQLRQAFKLGVNFRPVEDLRSDLDLVIFRENTEGLYIGEEIKISEDEYHANRIITRQASSNIITAAFEYAKRHNRKKVTLVHKANILKLTDGLFLSVGKEISASYKDIEFESLIVDNMCMQLVLKPSQFDVIVAPNLYGDILSDLCAGLIGGLGVVPGANLSDEIAIFEAVHGTAPDIAGKDLANPISLLLSACLMLDHIGYKAHAKMLRTAIKQAVNNNQTTKDLGGHHTCTSFTDYIINQLEVLNVESFND
ncbi:isocitrate/isopropylmalate dehydrogenase family protein [Acidaminobacter sp. JC074]|uniref:isocitrate/isopropylmalate dehydrogenase family protein n=1 Tax=Acidaminobacter sp. JC074 TaxID=2530199 RepID=UPI001F0D817D|nr:isocitrate/isopropylmalate dehydrogenase family protein [Acidaminobacter sp. JC074]MCH4888958.1 isocitrate/isopropylmalate dehydrogenase family protein [Acidaminobacter sp. JC074]